MNKGHASKRLNQLPSWLWTNSTTLPPVYKTVWEAVREDCVRSNGVQSELLVDTNKIFPLLLTSQLPTEVLGHIWNLANQKYAGQLTEQELYVVLALVAAAQTSYTFNSLDILHLLPFPPTPYLNVECLMNLQTSAQANATGKSQYVGNETAAGGGGAEVTDGRHIADVRTRGKTKAVQGNAAAPGDVKNHRQPSDVGDPFRSVKQQQQQAPRVPNDNVVQPASSTYDEFGDDFTEFQSAPSIPSVAAIPMWDSKQGSAIGSRLANHNLGVKKSADRAKRTAAAAGSKAVVVHVNAQTRAPASSYQGNKDQPATTMTTTTTTTTTTSVSAAAAADHSLSNMFPKCAVKNQSKTVILRDTAIRSNEITAGDYGDGFSGAPASTATATEVARFGYDKEASPHQVEITPKAVTVDTSDSAQQDLMSLQLVEDKYSALRELVQETSSVANDASLDLTCNSQSADEFGEFMSAEQPVANPPTSDPLVDSESFSNVFADFEFKAHVNNVDSSSLTDLNFVSEVTESFDNLKLDDGIEGQSVESGKNVQKEDAISINSVELISGPSEALPRSGSVPSLDLKSFLPSNIEEDQVVEAPQQNMYWEWKQYMESCVLLLQIAANIFTNITSELVLHEVLNSAQGYNFLCYLAEVAAVCRRVNFSYKELDINIIGFDDLLMDIDRIWAEMEPFYANIPIVTELPAWPLHQGESMSCSLCLTVITSGRIVYNDNNYHSTCANLWLNCVNSQLPVMRYSLLHIQPNICPGSHI